MALSLTGRELCPPAIRHFQSKVLRSLLARLDFEQYTVPLGVEFARRSLVHRESGIDQVALMGDQPLRAVECTGGLLAASESKLDGAAGAEVLLLEAHQRVDPDRGLGLVVDGTARVEGAVLLHELERVAGPVLALRFDDVDVRQEQNGLELGIAAGIHGDQSALLGVIGRREGVQIRVGEARGLQTSRHALGGEGAAAARERRVGFDQLLVKIPEGRLSRAAGSCSIEAYSQQEKAGGHQDLEHEFPKGALLLRRPPIIIAALPSERSQGLTQRGAQLAKTWPGYRRARSDAWYQVPPWKNRCDRSRARPKLPAFETCRRMISGRCCARGSP